MECFLSKSINSHCPSQTSFFLGLFGNVNTYGHQQIHRTPKGVTDEKSY